MSEVTHDETARDLAAFATAYAVPMPEGSFWRITVERDHRNAERPWVMRVGAADPWPPEDSDGESEDGDGSSVEAAGFASLAEAWSKARSVAAGLGGGGK